ncbi:M56 family metallopeptidase [Hymenobacter sp. BRD67]|uniref:M56 family metallopeptidase n=1 Tax=Hymenobacter sp. BRD67 TaxID=2675877 RepID=UPI0015646A5D|nr:M56 family metallopeptidase [Hymenobacter sp. BRD67]QKG54121.1 hypothetical protein GKZ67_17865 [Hymenobacter sp. BRD67]
MANLMLYLLKANVVLALFAVAYYGLLRRLTFFGLNRAYLLLALLFAAAYPALPMPALLPAEAAQPLAWPISPDATVVASSLPGSAGIGWLNIVFYAYLAGAGLLLLRLLGQLLSLALVATRSRPGRVVGQPVRILAGAAGPFSFGSTIYLSEAALADAAGLPAALHHEQAHVRQWHTADVLLTQLFTALAWPNPAAWLMRRAVLDNLEYLADRAALQTGLDRRAYQYCLLRQQAGGVPAPALAFHFSFLTLKNRITMLNQPASTTRQLGRYLLAAPLIMALALGYTGARAQVAPTPVPAQKPMTKNVTYYLDGKLTTQAEFNKINPDDIQSMDVIKDAAQRKALGLSNSSSDGIVSVITKANVNSPDVAAFNKRVPLTPATVAQNAGVAAVTAYVIKNYPNARLETVSIVNGQADRYKAIFIENSQRMQLLFDGKGQPVKQ